MGDILAEIQRLRAELGPPPPDTAMACHPITLLQLQAQLPPSDPISALMPGSINGVPIYTHKKIDAGKVWQGDRALIRALVRRLGPEDDDVPETGYRDSGDEQQRPVVPSRPYGTCPRCGGPRTDVDTDAPDALCAMCFRRAAYQASKELEPCTYRTPTTAPTWPRP